jgi:glycosyltransferase involved in cell wall biosynthesis
MHNDMKGWHHDIVTVDVDRPLDAIILGDNSFGVAVDVRRGRRPVGFLLKSCAPRSRITATELEEWIEREVPRSDREQPVSVDGAIGTIPHLTISVCTKDHPELLDRCLTSIEELRIEPCIPILDLLVVDNASQDDRTYRVALSHKGVRYVREDRVGLNFARNRALAEAQGVILAFIDDDAVVDPEWGSGLWQAWSRSRRAGAFAGQTLPLELETRAQVLVERMGGFRKGFQPVVYGLTNADDPLYPCTTKFGNGCNMAFSVEAMRSLGGFDEALDTGAPLPGGGDLDALYRIVRHGYELVYDPQMLVWHQHRRDFAGLRRQIRRSWGAGCMAFLTKIRDYDPEVRDRAKIFIHWWVWDLSRRLMPGHDRSSQPWSLVFHEFVGALIGLTGIYERSKRRSARIRSAVDGRNKR